MVLSGSGKEKTRIKEEREGGGSHVGEAVRNNAMSRWRVTCREEIITMGHSDSFGETVNNILHFVSCKGVQLFTANLFS